MVHYKVRLTQLLLHVILQNDNTLIHLYINIYLHINTYLYNELCKTRVLIGLEESVIRV